MAKSKTAFNDLDLWREYCDRLRNVPFPETVADALRITVPEQHKRISGNWEILGGEGPMSSLPYDGDRFAETRTPIARAATAITKSMRVKRTETKRRHLKVALAWLECQHPWQGPRSKLEIAARIKDVKFAIEEPLVPLDHLLDPSFYFRFHPKIELTPEDKTVADAIRSGLVLQLRFVSFSMTDGGFSLMITSPW